MPPKITFSDEERQIILNLFSDRQAAHQTQTYLVNCFALETNRNVSYSTLLAQYQALNNANQRNVFYHETQVADLCGKHALNNLLQRELFTVQYLNEISARLSLNEAAFLLPGTERSIFGINGNYSIEVLINALIGQGYIPNRLLDAQVVQAMTEVSAAAYLVSITGHYYAIRRFNNNGPLWIFESLKPRPYIDNDHFQFLINSGGSLNYTAIYQVFDQSGQVLPAMPVEIAPQALHLDVNEAIELERCSQVTRTFSTLSFNPSEEEIFSDERSMIDNDTMSTISEAITNNRSKRRRRALTLRGERDRNNANRWNLRNHLSPTTRDELRNLNTTSRIEARDNLSPSIRSQIRCLDTESRNRARRNLSPATRDEIRINDAERSMVIRDEETMMEREERLGLARRRRHQRRFTHANYKRAYFDPSEPFPSIPAYNIGSPDLICEHCGSKYWAAELNTNREFTKCCHKGKVVIPIITQYHDTLRKLLVYDVNHSPADREYRLHFLENIRQYNYSVAFSAIQSNFDVRNFDNQHNRRPFIYKVHGAMYYCTPPIIRENNSNHNYQTAQYYVLDSDIAHEQRMNAWRNDNGLLNENILTRLENMLNEPGTNPFAEFFKQNKQVLEEQSVNAPMNAAMYLVRASLSMLEERREYRRVRNMNLNIVGGEIAAVFGDVDGLPPTNIHHAIFARNGRRSRMDNRDPNVDPMCFPLLFPYGEAGYDQSLTHARRTRVLNRTTLKEFYAHKLHFKHNNLNLPFLSGKLFQEYVVSAYMKVESNDLNWIKMNQKRLRVETYKGLMDHASTRYTPQNILEGAGAAVILPSTKEGSDRAQAQHYLDAMAVSKQFGKADFFVTMTANPDWPEIQEHLSPGQSYLDRPDICARVYEMKYKKLMDMILKEHILGVIAAYVATKEYQKRGLGHNHNMFTLDPADKITTGEELDRIIRADIPDPETEPELHALVVKFMIHGPCHTNNACMQKDGVNCSKGYPKPFSEVTILTPGQFPTYKRPNNGRFVMKGRFKMTNQHVVPYCPMILMVIVAHVNFEYCAFLMSMIYIFKYITKGNDRASIVTVMPEAQYDALSIIDQNNERVEIDPNNLPFVQNIVPFVNAAEENQEPVDEAERPPLAPIDQHDEIVEMIDDYAIHAPDNRETVTTYDEIKSYQQLRYVSSIEACDNIFGHKRLLISHSVFRLQLHLPELQTLLYDPNNIEAALERAEIKNTHLDAWFKLNQTNEEARQFLYTEIPLHYTFDSSNYLWHIKERGHDNVIVRLHRIYPKGNQELYHLRMLLLHVRGATSYEFLRTVNGVVYDTFTLAAVALNLVNNNRQWFLTIQEALRTEHHYQVRFLYATILLHCNPTLPSALTLWETFRVEMSQDYVHYGDTEHVAIHKSLQHIKHVLNTNNQDLADFGLPEPDMTVGDWRIERTVSNQLIPRLRELTPEEHAQIADQQQLMLNEEQRPIYEAVMAAVNNNNQFVTKCFFIDGIGGCGKTFLLNLILHRILGMNLRSIATAFTGIAASLLINGQTLHSMFKPPIPCNSGDNITRIKKNTPQAYIIRYSKILIVDEASQISKSILEALDRFLRDLCDLPNVPFGGICILLAGDFRQCLPIIEFQGIDAGVTHCLKMSYLWEHFDINHLTVNVRADPDEIEFKDWTLSIGNGTAPVIDQDSLIRLDDRVVVRENIIDEVFGAGSLTMQNLRNTNKAILCPTNKDSLEINEVINNRLEGQNYVYLSTDSVETPNNNEEDIYPIENAHATTPKGFPKHELNVKVGSTVILLKNYSIANGLCNGTRLQVVACNQETIRCVILFGLHAGQEYSFHRMVFTPDQREVSIKITRIQFPFRLAFAMTINKSQGQTFDMCGILLRDGCFSHGQFYVGVSRPRNFASLKIMVIQHDHGANRQGTIAGFEGVYTRNIVHRQVLQDRMI